MFLRKPNRKSNGKKTKPTDCNIHPKEERLKECKDQTSIVSIPTQGLKEQTIHYSKREDPSITRADPMCKL